MSRISVLLVDDELALLLARARLLKRLSPDWEVAMALSGEEALALLEKARIDVVVADVRMDGMPGTELLRLVKERHPAIVRMTLSGVLEQRTLVEKAKWSELDLCKPCTVEQLQEGVLEAIRRRRASTGAADGGQIG